MKQYVLVAGGGASQVFLVKALSDLKLNIILIDRDRNCPCREFADKFINESTYSEKNWRNGLAGLGEKFVLIGLLTASSGHPVLALSELSKNKNIPAYSRKAAKLATSKVKFRSLFSEVKHQHGSKLLDIHSAGLEFPVIIKADTSIRGKESVRWAWDQDSYSAAFRHVKKESLSGRVVVEKLVQGTDYIFVGLVKNGALLFLIPYIEKNLLKPDGSLFSLGIFGPSEVDTSIFTIVSDKIAALLERYGIENCPISFSVRVSGQCVYPIELHLDFGGESVFDWLIRPILPNGIKDTLSLLLLDEGGKCAIQKRVPDFCNAILYNCNSSKVEHIRGLGLTIKDSAPSTVLVSGSQGDLNRYFLESR